MAAVREPALGAVLEGLLKGEGISTGSDGHALAWLESMRRDLQALGLERKAPQVALTLEAHIADHDKAAARVAP